MIPKECRKQLSFIFALLWLWCNSCTHHEARTVTKNTPSQFVDIVYVKLGLRRKSLLNSQIFRLTSSAVCTSDILGSFRGNQKTLEHSHGRRWLWPWCLLSVRRLGLWPLSGLNRLSYNLRSAERGRRRERPQTSKGDSLQIMKVYCCCWKNTWLISVRHRLLLPVLKH